MPKPAKPPSTAHAERPVRPRFFGLMKASTVFLAAALLMQGITAGQLLSNEGSRQLRHATGPLVTVAMVLQIIAALLVWRAGRGPVRYPAVSALLMVLVSVQFVVGGSGNLAVHVPLGVALFGASAVLVAQVWSPRPPALPTEPRAGSSTSGATGRRGSVLLHRVSSRRAPALSVTRRDVDLRDLLVPVQARS